MVGPVLNCVADAFMKVNNTHIGYIKGWGNLPLFVSAAF